MMNNNGFSNGYNCSFEMFHSFWGMGMLALVVAIICIIVYKYKRNISSNDSAIKILDTKFASGEITEEEYKSRKRVLKDK